MAKRKGASTSGPRTRSRAAKERQVEDTRRLDKLPQEVWDKILDHPMRASIAVMRIG